MSVLNCQYWFKW